MLETGKAAPWIETIVLVGARNPVGEYQMIAQVQQATKINFVSNTKTAGSLGIEVPLPLLGRADEVIE